MKRSQICLVILGLWLCLGASSLAQAPPNFRLQLSPPNAEPYFVEDANNLGVVVGHEGSKSFVFDQNGIIGDQESGKMYLLEELVDIPPEISAEYTFSQTYAINESCQVVGRLRNDSLRSIAFFADLNDPLSFELLPNPASTDNVRGYEINDHSDVLIYSRMDGEPKTYYIYNPLDPATDPVLLTDPDTNQPLSDAIATGFNNFRQVVGYFSGSGGAFCLTPGTSATPGTLETFSELYTDDINDDGQFCGSLFPGYDMFFRYTDTDQIELISGEIYGSGESAINRAGDVAMSSRDTQSSLGRASVHHDDYGLLDLDDLVVGDSGDLAYWNAASLNEIDINDRDAETGFGQIFGKATRTTTTGRGKKRVTITEYRIFILTPIAPPAPEPGITVTPTDGLFTTETGDVAEFEVVLDTAPMESVTIDISTGDVTEGLIDDPELGFVEFSSLTFTSDNWDTPQTVMITGVDDEFVDGSVPYTIVTAPAISDDQDYDEFDPEDVNVTNLDDEQAPMKTYDSLDPAKAIPDRGMTESTITITDDFTIVNMVVTLNISHPRPSDLDVFLVGPNDEVQLYTFNGPNDVSNFNGMSTDDSWTLKVYDTRKKKDGDLIGWSITVEIN